MRSGMNIRKFATISLLVLSSFAANNVAPSKAELESMYDKAFREFNTNNYQQALKELDAIDARQPDLAESQNLRGVIAMRQSNYEQAEQALQKALAADPKFWNARFNLAEIPFLKKDWTEARNRFEGLLSGNKAELQGEALQLIQYKILLTYLLEGKENMVDSVHTKLELSPDTPAVAYANAAVAFQRKNEKEAKDQIAAAEKNFSPQLNKLFVESLYEIGWLQKPAGQNRAALELTSATERAAKTKEFARTKFERAEQALQQRDLTAAKKLVNEADAADPNQPAILNLRGEILLAQKDFEAADAAFRQAAKADPNMREAQFNLAQIPFKKKEYATARDRFEALSSATPAPGGDKNQAAQLIKFKIYLTLLLEGKDSRAQKMMEQFQFTGDTPALYYAQAAWEFKHNNASKANDWVVSARKIYSPAMNMVFADAFYDLGWLQNQAASPAPVVAEAKVEATPPIEPSPIPGAALAANNATKQPADTAPQKPPGSTGTVPSVEATTANGNPPAVAIAQASASKPQNTSTAPVAALSPSVETPVASTASSADTRIAKAPEPQPQGSAAVASQPPPVIAKASVAPSIPSVKPAAPAGVAKTTISATPATVLAPATVREWSQPTFGERLERFVNARTLLVGGLLLAGAIIIAWVLVPEVRRRVSSRATNVPVYRPAASAIGPHFRGGVEMADQKNIAEPARLAGGPPQVSLQLKASEPSFRRVAVPFGKPTRPFGSGGAIATAPSEHAGGETPQPIAPPTEVRDVFHDGAGEPIAEIAETLPVSAVVEPEALDEEPVQAEPQAAMEPAQISEVSEPETFAEVPAFIAPMEGISYAPAPVASHEPLPAATEPAFQPVAEAPATVGDATPESAPIEASIADAEPIVDAPPAPPQLATSIADAEPIVDGEAIGQGQPIPYQIPAVAAESPVPATAEREQEEQPWRLAQGWAAAAFAGLGAIRRSPAQPATQETIPTEPPAQQPTTQATMPEPTQPISAPAIRTAPQAPAIGGALQPQPHAGGGMQTAVQLTFSFEIASLQLTPSFKMGALQLKPSSKIVTMRLAPSQQPQPAMNLQVTFEIATVQLAGNSIGQIRLTPSQQQKPSITGSPAFNVAGLQLLSGESGAVQLTTSQQGQASVHVTARFQIATVEFSQSFEIASLVLNSISKSVLVQLPGGGPSAVEGAPMFEISTVQLAGNGEIGMMQLNPQAAGQRPA